ncbi:tRNA-splicing endonuclease subunit Sen34 [Physocladia obscura]|uniref:tRNA-intron lyase n=1 Tax=Physocladia obscura TaxID=109957 RepID=A0AAD5XI81_9FUNG|nr:tRNA-splicing endonuclease subunit Sen34 [Physocladia obscura]
MDLIPKLDHHISEIRHRAWASLFFKLENELLPNGFLAGYDAPLVSSALKYINDSASFLPSTDSTSPFSLAKPISLILDLMHRNPFLAKTAVENDVIRILSIILSSPPLNIESETINSINAILALSVSQPTTSKKFEGTTTTAATAATATTVTTTAATAARKGKEFFSVPSSTFEFKSQPRTNSQSNTSLYSYPLNLKKSLPPSSPRRRSLSPIKQSICRIPEVPNAIQTYNYIHLSPIDEDAIADFLLFLDGSSSGIDDNGNNDELENIEIEAKLFHILLTDFGGQIFLQKPRLFRLILSNMTSATADDSDFLRLQQQRPTAAVASFRTHQSRMYMTKLVSEFGKILRMYIDGPASLGSRTPISATTPNVSMMAVGAGDEGNYNNRRFQQQQHESLAAAKSRRRLRGDDGGGSWRHHGAQQQRQPRTAVNEYDEDDGEKVGVAADAGYGSQRDDASPLLLNRHQNQRGRYRQDVMNFSETGIYEPAAVAASSNGSTEQGEERVDLDTGGISIPYACHKIYWGICGLIASSSGRQCDDFEQFVGLLKTVLPIVVMHLDLVHECVGYQGSGGGSEVDDWCWDYVSALFPCVCSVGGGGSGSYDSNLLAVKDSRGLEVILWKEKFLEIACDLISAFETVSVDHVNLQWKTARSILNLPTFTWFPRAFVKCIVPALHSDVAATVCFLNVIGHAHSWVRTAGYIELLSLLKTQENAEHDDCGLGLVTGNTILQYVAVKSVFREPQAELRDLAIDFVNYSFKFNSKTRNNKPGFIDFVQIFADEDGGDDWFANMALSADDTLLWMKGMFHRSEIVRKFSFDHLIKSRLFKETTMTTTFPDAFVFNQSVLLMKPESTNFSDGRLNSLDLNVLIDELKNNSKADIGIISLGFEKLLVYIHDTTMTRRAKELDLLTVLLNCLVEKRDWLRNDNMLLQTLKICRILVSGSLEAVWKAINENFVISLVHPEYIFSSNEFVRYEFAKLMFLILFNHYNVLGDSREFKAALAIVDDGTIFLFDSVPEKYFVYVTSDIISTHALESVECFREFGPGLDELFQDYRTVKYEISKNPGQVWLNLSVDRLLNAKSHQQFHLALDALFNSVIFEEDFARLANFDLSGLFHRFLINHPANYADEQLLIHVIRQISKACSKSDVAFSCMKDILFKSLSVLAIPVIQSSIHIKSPESDLSLLSSELIVLLRQILKRSSPVEMTRILQLSNCLQALINYTYHVFSFECKDVKSHTDRISCLKCLFEFTQFSGFVAAVSGQIASSFVQLLVSVIGCSQQNYSTDGNAFTYQDRSIYRLVARSLRNLSRCFVVLQKGFKDWLWGDHWLFEGDIEWLLILLNDDEIIVQKSGLGILGNLILIKDSYPLLCLKIPQFLDMAFLFALDFERSYTLRKEALLIINNFLITFCHDNKISEIALLPISDESLVDIQASLKDESKDDEDSNSLNKVLDLLELFDNCGFFEQLKALLVDCDKFAIIYMDALTQLLLNLCILAPKVLFQKFCETDSWNAFFNFLELTQTKNHGDNKVQMSQSVLANLKAKQFTQCYSHFIESVQCNVLNIVRVIIELEDVQMRLYIFENTNLLDHIKNFVTDSESWIMATDDEWLERDETGVKIVRLCCAALNKKETDAETMAVFKKMTCLALSRMLALHYGCSMNLNMDKYLAASDSILPEERCFGEQIIYSFICMTGDVMADFDLTYIEAVKISMQILLARFTPAKNFAISKGFVEILVSQIEGALKNCKSGRTNEKHRITLHFHISLLRHALAESNDAKKTAYSCGIATHLADALHLTETNDMIQIETLLCIHNAFSNNHSSPLWGKHTQKPGLLILDATRKLMKSKAQVGEVFEACICVLKAMVLQHKFRVVLVKSGFMDDCLEILKKLVKEKDAPKAAQLLELICNFSFALDGQINVMKTKGLFAFLVDILGWKSLSVHIACIAVLQNLASAKENKPHFLADELFLPRLMKLLEESKSPVVAESLTSLIEILAFDSEKTKAALKHISSKTQSLRLRAEDHIVGAYVGTFHTLPNQNRHFGLPLQLLPSQVDYIASLKNSLSRKYELSLDDETTGIHRRQQQQEQYLREQLAQVISQVHNNRIFTTRQSESPTQLSKTPATPKTNSSLKKSKHSSISSILRSNDIHNQRTSIIATENADVSRANTPECVLIPMAAVRSIATQDVGADNERREKAKTAVFEHLHKSGFYITSGVKFGADFLAYQGDPLLYHAAYVCLVVPNTKTKNITPLDIIGYARMGRNAKKKIMLCGFDAETGSVSKVVLDWTGWSVKN